MGKILQYLGVSEEGQNRDILDAERLLEGMQMIYSQSPDGSKKDSFSVPLAEMTKIFIEKVKGIEPTPTPEPEVQEELPFKVGDRFIEKASPNIILTITKIEDERIDLEWVKQNGNIEEFQNACTLYEAKKNFETGYWTLVKEEELPFKVGDKFTKKGDYAYIYSIEELNINDDEVTISYIDKEDGKIIIFYSLNLVKEKFASDEWVLVNYEEFPYKVGDKFKVLITDSRFSIISINDDNIDIGFYTGDGNIDIYNATKEEFINEVALGVYIKITDEEFSPKPQPESKPQKPKRTRKPKEETEQDKQIREILEINLDDIEL
jgi:hypothetical protein